MDDADRREIQETARWHARANALPRPVAEVLAYKHAGFVNESIASELETTKHTVKKYLQRVEVVYGPEAVLVQKPGYREDFDPVTAEQITEWPEHYQQWWLEAGRTHYDAVPASLKDRFPNHPG